MDNYGKSKHPVRASRSVQEPDSAQESRSFRESGSVRAAGRYRYSVADETPRRSATSATRISGLASNVLATSRSPWLSFGGGLLRPARFAAASRARVRSRMRARSNSARALTKTPFCRRCGRGWAAALSSLPCECRAERHCRTRADSVQRNAAGRGFLITATTPC